VKRTIVTGAAGFAGCNLVEALLEKGCFAYAVVRPGSIHNVRLRESDRLRIIACDMAEYDNLWEKITEQCDICYHLAWQGERDNFAVQYQNVKDSLSLLEAVAKIGCKRIVCTGSQAEYGLQSQLITEETCPHPVTAYGTAKLAACLLTRQRASELDIEWVWGRIFSLYGKYEPQGRMLPDLLQALIGGHEFHLTAAKQNWDYLYSSDGAKALVALGEHGRNGEIYNVANGKYHPLCYYTEILRECFAPKRKLRYDLDISPIVSLQPSVEKIYKDTGWRAEISFVDGIKRCVDRDE